jgi:restriction system protein
MAVPDFQSFMLPLLVIASDDKEHSLSGAIDRLADQFSLSAEDRREVLPSGRQARLDNRVGWALTHLRKASLMKSMGRGKFQITVRGQKVLENRPAAINMKFLKQFPEFVEFRKRQNDKVGEDIEQQEETKETPEEMLEASYQNLRRNLAQELLDHAKQVAPRFFESLVVDLLVSMGYGGSRKDAGQAVGQSGDGGIDGIIKEDKLGLDAVYIQAKRWEKTVGRPDVQGFVGSLAGRKAKKGVFITTSQFTKEAKEYVQGIDTKVVLIDGELLTQLMIDHNVGVAEVSTYIVKKIDLDYFGEE